MAYKYDALVFIGRFQPLHLGHQSVIDRALELAEEVIVVVGSSFAARDIRNPFTFDERKQMIRSVYDKPTAYKEADQTVYRHRVKIVPVADYPYDDNKWVAAIQTAVMGAMKFQPGPLKVGLIGHSKDHTSYYLNMFPMWASENVSNYNGINSTDIRSAIFSMKATGLDIRSLIPSSTFNYMSKLAADGPDGYSEEWMNLRQEYKMIYDYKKEWECAPYPPTFLTVDAVVVQSGHILLVKRKASPGKGLWALPGGFLNQNETMLDGAIRELKEETKIKVPVPVLRGSIREQKVFDAPNRSLRGRTVTQAFFIDLGMTGALPKVTGADDAEKAKWFSFRELSRDMFFEDHFAIIDYFLNIG